MLSYISMKLPQTLNADIYRSSVGTLEFQGSHGLYSKCLSQKQTSVVYFPWHDQGGFPRVRLLYCTWDALTYAISPNAENSAA